MYRPSLTAIDFAITGSLVDRVGLVPSGRFRHFLELPIRAMVDCQGYGTQRDALIC
jgi:hypothetical protein